MDDKNSNITVQSVPIKGLLYSRVGHRVLRLNAQALILGGTGLSGEFLKTILRFNLENLKIEPISNVVLPNLQGFSAFTFKNKVYLWGGNLQNKICNNLWCLQGTNFELCVQNGQIPPPRAFHCSAIVAGKYLLVYGGYGQTQIYNEWYILNFENLCWYKVQTNLQLPKNVKFQLAWQNGRGFLVSSHQITRTGCKINMNVKNEIYQLRIINFSTFRMRIDRVQYFQGQKYLPRSNFSLLFFQNQLWILGGQCQNQKRSIQLEFCTDVWTLNIQTLNWNKKPITLNTKSNFQILQHKNKLYLVGGLKSMSQMSCSLQTIQFRDSIFETQICNFCKSVFSIDAKAFYKKPEAIQFHVRDSSQIGAQISTNFISKIARYLQNPIQAIGLLVDNSLNMGASSISIHICSPELCTKYYKQPIYYLYIGDNSNSFSTDQIIRILFSFRFIVQKYYRDHIDIQDAKIRNEYGLNLKLASLRLGSSCLLVTHTIQGQTFVAYFSDYQTQCPDGQASFNCYYYHTDQKRCSNNIDRQIIRQNTKHLVSEAQYLNLATHSTKVYIFGLHDINKISNSNNKNDIVYPHSHGLQLTSLTEYISCLYLNPYLGRQIQVQKNKIIFLNLVTRFKQDQKNGDIKQIDTNSENGILSKPQLYRIQKASYPVNYVYIYHQNRLITKIQSKEKAICGYIQIPDEIQVDFFKSKLERWQNQRKLISFIQSKEEPRRRQRNIQNCIPQEQMRKIKPPYYNYEQKLI